MPRKQPDVNYDNSVICYQILSYAMFVISVLVLLWVSYDTVNSSTQTPSQSDPQLNEDTLHTLLHAKANGPFEGAGLNIFQPPNFILPGAHVLGPLASALLNEGLRLIQGDIYRTMIPFQITPYLNATWQQRKLTIHPQPTRSEQIICQVEHPTNCTQRIVQHDNPAIHFRVYQGFCPSEIIGTSLPFTSEKPDTVVCFSSNDQRVKLTYCVAEFDMNPKLYVPYLLLGHQLSNISSFPCQGGRGEFTYPTLAIRAALFGGEALLSNVEHLPSDKDEFQITLSHKQP